MMSHSNRTSLDEKSGVNRHFYVIFDVRALQDRNYAYRGVGRHILNIIANGPSIAGLSLIGLTDPNLPPLIDEAGALFDHIVSNAYAAERLIARSPMDVALFVSSSPMTHSPEFAGRLLVNPRIVRASIVYDFIPQRYPERYMPLAVDRLRYAAALRWLARSDIFASISKSAAADLQEQLGIHEKDIVVTGCPLTPILFEDHHRQGTARHILIVGGGDPRKNPEVVVRAHARLRAAQDGRGIPLVVAGNYSPADAHMFRALSVASGGSAALIEVPGHISDKALFALYRDALAVVAPSRDEGFSLPVIEAMASGAVCIGSDIPAHRELIIDSALRFDPDDDERLAETLTRLVKEPSWRAQIISQQAGVWPRFKSQEVSSRFWTSLLDRARRPVSPAISQQRKPRVAMLSPLPPDRSGVADYTAASCADLGRLVDLHLFTETLKPTPRPGVSSIRPLSALPHLMPGFDRVISVVGNSHFHLRIFEQLQRFGGACIAHDARMLGFYRIMLSADRALAVASRELGRPVSHSELDAWLGDEGKLEALFLGEIAAAASPMIVHSPITAELCETRYGTKPAYVPFSIYRPWHPEELSASERAQARGRMGVGEDDIVVATFGFVHLNKAPEECIWALDSLRRWGIRARLHFVGDLNLMPNAGQSLVQLTKRLGLSAHVRFWGNYVSEQDYRDHLVGSDLGIQLRTYGLGGLSGALLDCAAAGLPSVANQGLVTSVGVPDAYTRAIPDAISPFLLAEALADLNDASKAPGAALRKEEARTTYSRERSFAAYARNLCHALDLDVTASVGRRTAA